jgi:hypothetical protein
MCFKWRGRESPLGVRVLGVDAVHEAAAAPGFEGQIVAAGEEVRRP